MLLFANWTPHSLTLPWSNSWSDELSESASSKLNGLPFLSRSSFSWVSMHVHICVHISIHTLCSAIPSRLVCTTVLNLGSDLINLPPAALLLWQVSSHSHHPAVLCGSSICWLVLCVCVHYRTFLRSGEWVPSLIAHGSSHHTSFSCVLRDTPKKCTSFDKLQRSVKYTYICSHKCVLACTHMHVSSVRKSFAFFVLFLHRLWATSNTFVSRRWACNWSWRKDPKGKSR